MQTNFNQLIPKGVLFSLRQIEELNIIKVDMMKKLINKGQIEIVKVGNKLFVSRTEIIRYLETNTIPAYLD